VEKRYKWPAEVAAKVIQAHREGGSAAVYAAFPDRERKAVDAAILRFVIKVPKSVPVSAIPSRTGLQARAALRAMPADLLLDAVALMMPRNANFAKRVAESE